MDSRLQQFLQHLALTRGQRKYAPESAREEDLQNFQNQVDEIKRLAAEKVLNIVGDPHRESRTGKRYIDRINVELTAKGVTGFTGESNTANRNDSGPSAQTEEDLGRSLTREAQFKERLENLKRDFDDKILSPLRSDLRIQGMNAYEAWKRDFLAFLERHLPHEADRFKRITTHSDKSSPNQKENAYNSFMRAEGKTCMAFMEAVAEEAAAGKNLAESAGTLPRVFLSYAREDSAVAFKLYNELSAKGLSVWIDSESLLPGQNWKSTIRQAIRKSRYFIALLSRNSVSKKGYVQKELKDALDILEEYPISSVFIIPARLDDCTPSDDRLRDLHWVNLFETWEAGVDRILRTIADSPR